MWAVILVIILLLSLVVYFKEKNRYWYYKKVHAPRSTIFLGNVYNIIKNKKGGTEYFKELYNKYKPRGFKYIGIYIFATPKLIVLEPKLIKAVLQTDFQHFADRPLYVNEKIDPLSGHLLRLNGSKWKILRTKLTPTFTSGKMKIMFQILLECSYGLKSVVKQLVNTNEPIDIKNVISRFTTDVIVSTALGLECNTLENQNSEFSNIKEFVFGRSRREDLKQHFANTFPWLADLLKLKVLNTEVANFFTKLITDTINFREVNDIERKDFLHLLIQLKEDSKVNKVGSDSSLTLTLNEITAQVILFFFAGFETSSNSLTFCIYELALNEDIQSNVRNEIISVLNKYNGAITYEALMDMSYMELCIKETLRKYPTSSVLVRLCTKTYKIPDSDVVIDKGTGVIIPVSAIHMDEEYYPEPDVFNPNRYLAKDYSFTWLPFGEGPRSCIGVRFAMTQIKVALIMLMLNYKFFVHDKTEVPIRVETKSFFIVPKTKVWLRAETIQNKD